MEQLAPHAKVYVDPAFIDDPNHGGIDCHDCHGGDPGAEDALAAHDGLVRDPTWPDPKRACGDCHPDEVAASRASLHATLSPFKTMIDARAGNAPNHPQVEAGRKAHCNACHASCGQCHVSRPAYVGGGLLDAHSFMAKPPMREVCTACHGSRVEHEYFGKNEGAPPDVHWRKRFMDCGACHDADEMHGGQGTPANRYEAPGAPACVDCHEDIYDDGAPNREQHAGHRDKASCQVCHAAPYKNCTGCHFALDRYGLKYFQNDASTLDFKIGLNPRRSASRPERFVTLRHVPVAPDSFRFYAAGGLADFGAAPTWKLCTPHSIRRATPQNAACNDCHGNRKLFLTADDVKGPYKAANRNVVVPVELLPAKIETQQ